VLINLVLFGKNLVSSTEPMTPQQVIALVSALPAPSSAYNIFFNDPGLPPNAWIDPRGGPVTGDFPINGTLQCGSTNYYDSLLAMQGMVENGLNNYGDYTNQVFFISDGEPNTGSVGGSHVPPSWTETISQGDYAEALSIYAIGLGPEAKTPNAEKILNSIINPDGLGGDQYIHVDNFENLQTVLSDFADITALGNIAADNVLGADGVSQFIGWVDPQGGQHVIDWSQDADADGFVKITLADDGKGNSTVLEIKENGDYILTVQGKASTTGYDNIQLILEDADGDTLTLNGRIEVYAFGHGISPSAYTDAPRLELETSDTALLAGDALSFDLCLRNAQGDDTTFTTAIVATFVVSNDAGDFTPDAPLNAPLPDGNGNTLVWTHNAETGEYVLTAAPAPNNSTLHIEFATQDSADQTIHLRLQGISDENGNPLAGLDAIHTGDGGHPLQAGGLVEFTVDEITTGAGGDGLPVGGGHYAAEMPPQTGGEEFQSSDAASAKEALDKLLALADAEGKSLADYLKDHHDIHLGGDGADVIYGGSGNNVLFGGSGTDIFALRTEDMDGGVNYIADFTRGEDILRFDDQFSDPASAMDKLLAVAWDSNSQSFTGSHGGSSISLTIENDRATVVLQADSDHSKTFVLDNVDFSTVGQDATAANALLQDIIKVGG
jgi:hypothetical protein